MSKIFNVGQKWKARNGATICVVKVSDGGATVNCKSPIYTYNVDPDGRHDGVSAWDVVSLMIPVSDIVQTSTPRDLTLRDFQTNLPWTIRYSYDFRSSPMTHKDFAHTMHHVSKAAGHLHALTDDMDHDREIADDSTLRDRYAKYVADLVVCALRLANTFPGGVIDLQAAVHDRIENKNNVTLPTKE